MYVQWNINLNTFIYGVGTIIGVFCKPIIDSRNPILKQLSFSLAFIERYHYYITQITLCIVHRNVHATQSQQ